MGDVELWLLENSWDTVSEMDSITVKECLWRSNSIICLRYKDQNKDFIYKSIQSECEIV